MTIEEQDDNPVVRAARQRAAAESGIAPDAVDAGAIDRSYVDEAALYGREVQLQPHEFDADTYLVGTHVDLMASDGHLAQIRAGYRRITDPAILNHPLFLAVAKRSADAAPAEHAKVRRMHEQGLYGSSVHVYSLPHDELVRLGAVDPRSVTGSLPGEDGRSEEPSAYQHHRYATLAAERQDEQTAGPSRPADAEGDELYGDAADAPEAIDAADATPREEQPQEASPAGRPLTKAERRARRAVLSSGAKA